MATYRELFAYREFRYLYAGQVLSYLGDQVAAVAVAVLVFDRTESALLSAIAYASSWLPGVLGGPILSTYADRLPRRAVLIGCDLARAVLIAVVALPGLPLWPAIALLYLATCSRRRSWRPARRSCPRCCPATRTSPATG